MWGTALGFKFHFILDIYTLSRFTTKESISPVNRQKNGHGKHLIYHLDTYIFLELPLPIYKTDLRP